MAPAAACLTFRRELGPRRGIGLAPPLIAIIDDDDGIRIALEGLMRSVSYRVESFPSAEAFVASNAAANFACIITDLSMRGMSGLELARLLKSEGRCVPIILISARADAELERRAKCNGARCLLRKPFESGALISLVEESLAS
jgi:FixJ family two-component response regulator